MIVLSSVSLSYFFYHDYFTGARVTIKLLYGYQQNIWEKDIYINKPHRPRLGHICWDHVYMSNWTSFTVKCNI